MLPLEDRYEIVALESGMRSLRSLNHRETFHPGIGPMEEARALHVNQQQLVERCKKPGPFVIWDVGLGAGANAIAAIEALQTPDADVQIHSFDKSTSPMTFALNHAEELEYLLPYQEPIRQLLSKNEVQVRPRLQWYFHLGSFRDELKKSIYPSPHSVFYDPYSPAENYEMWTLEHFEHLYQRLDTNVPCVLTHYSRSTAVRVSLLMAGFYVGTGNSIGKKAETTVFSNRLDLLKNPLERVWLNRVKVSGNGAPLRGFFYQKSPILLADFKDLENHSQFR